MTTVNVTANDPAKQHLADKLAVFLNQSPAGQEIVSEAERRAIEMLRCELRAMLNGGWQPIDTAPKDGTRLLIYDTDAFKRITIGHWSDDWIDEDNADVWSPTHWMPLPRQPADPDGRNACNASPDSTPDPARNDPIN